MKILKIVSVVFVFHVLAIVLLMVQPGCKTVEESGSGSSGEKSSAMNAYGPSKEAVRAQETENATVASTRYVPRRPAANGSDSTAERAKPTKPGSTELLTPITSVKEVSMNALIVDPKVAEPASTEYVVKSGDSLWVISKRFNVPMVDIMELNELNKQSVLKVGQKLKIPGIAATTDNAQKSSMKAMNSSEGMRYKVRNGDTLSGIASRYNVSIDDIKTANRMKSATIYAGKELTIPGISANNSQPALASAKSSTAKPADMNFSESDIHVVEPGESLSSIASYYGMSVSALQEMNSISDPKKLRVGQKLAVKGNKTAPKAIPQINTSPVNAANRSETSYAAADVLGVEEEQTRSPRIIGEAKVEQIEDMDDALFELDEEIPVVQVGKTES